MMSRVIVDRVSFKSSSAEATRIMRKYDPGFNLIDFEKEVDVKYFIINIIQIIFQQLMKAFLNDDIDSAKLVSGETALGLVTGMIKSRKERVDLNLNKGSLL